MLYRIGHKKYISIYLTLRTIRLLTGLNTDTVTMKNGACSHGFVAMVPTFRCCSNN